jgi:hypothetical protein
MVLASPTTVGAAETIGDRLRVGLGHGFGILRQASGDPEAFVLYAEAVATELRRRVGLAVSGPGRLSVDAELWVDPAEWKRTVDAMAEAATRLHDQARPPRSPGTVRVNVSAMLFRMDPG